MTVTLLAMTTLLLDAEDSGPKGLAAAIGAPPPPDWPPEFHGQDTRDWVRHRLTGPEVGPFRSYYILSEGAPVGTGGFTGPPDADGRVEIGYSVVPSAQGRGIATAVVRQLLSIAFADPRVALAVIETVPDRIASQRVAETCGFALTDRRPDPELGDILTYTCPRGT